MAIVHDQSLQGRGMADEIRRSAIAAHVAPLLVAPFVTGTKDYGALVAQIIEAKIDLVVFSSQPLEASIILDQADSAGARVETAVGTDTFAAGEPPARLLAATREFLVMLPWPGQEADVGAGAGAGEFGRPENFRKLAGAALEIWARAVVQAGSFAVDGVVAAMGSPTAAAGPGAIRFDDKGDAMVPSFVPHVWREGRWQVKE
jgi:branched-chain amino acid transport system substrate-binding protein